MLNISTSHDDLMMLHVNIIMLHIDIIMLNVDINNLYVPIKGANDTCIHSVGLRNA